MKKMVWGLIILLPQLALAQDLTYIHQQFCKELNKVFESGRKENFESLSDNMEKVSSLLPVPGYSVKLEPDYPILYVDKDKRFVGKTNQNFDSLTAIKKIDDYKAYLNFCLDTFHWTWTEIQGDDSTTVFFKELKEYRATEKDLTLTLAITHVATKVYSINLYIRRNSSRMTR